MRIGRIGVLIGACLIWLAAPDAGRAQENFPNRPIRMIIPYSVGSVVDVFGRIVAQNIAEQWKGTILSESKSGGNGSIAAEEVARSAPDGYTWLMVTTFFTASPSLNVALRWDPVRDFTPIGQICRAPNFFIVPTTLPVNNVAEYVALAREKPGKLNYSHPGKGSTGHLGFELFKRLAGIDVPGIGYRGYPQMVADISSGLITSSFLSANQALAQVQTGTIRIIGAINDGRSKYFPDVPTMAEQGYPGAQVTHGSASWFPPARPSRSSIVSARRSTRHWRRRTCSRNSTSPDVRRSRPRGRSLPGSSRMTSRCGRRSSRMPASRRIEGRKRALAQGL
jgi:tripartite-type tricarboxylate transporter receptor subunit TctC